MGQIMLTPSLEVAGEGRTPRTAGQTSPGRESLVFVLVEFCSCITYVVNQLSYSFSYLLVSAYFA